MLRTLSAVNSACQDGNVQQPLVSLRNVQQAHTVMQGPQPVLLVHLVLHVQTHQTPAKRLFALQGHILLVVLHGVQYAHLDDTAQKMTKTLNCLVNLVTSLRVGNNSVIHVLLDTSALIKQVTLTKNVEKVNMQLEVQQHAQHAPKVLPVLIPQQITRSSASLGFMQLKGRRSVQHAQLDSIVLTQIRWRSFLANWVIIPLAMHQLVKCALLGMNAPFRIKLSETFVQMEHIL